MNIEVNIKDTIRKYGITKDGREVCRSILDTGQIVWHDTSYFAVHPCDILTYPE